MSVLIAQCRYEQRVFWRSPLPVVTSIGFTPLFLFLIAGITGTSGDLLVRFLPGVITISAMSTCVLGIAVPLSYRRDQNVFKRFYATPIPPWTILLSVVLSATVNAVLVAFAALGFVIFVLGVEVSVNVPLFLGAIVVVALSLSWVGCALSRIPSQSVAAAANMIVFPVLFMSGNMFPLDQGVWYERIGRLFPSHFARQLVAQPLGVDLEGAAAVSSAVGLTIWAIAAAALGVGFFRWHASQDR